MSVDFSGDNAIGDSVSSIIASPRRDDAGGGDDLLSPDGRITNADTQKGAQLVKLTSGAVAVDYSGMASAGSPSDGVLALKLSTGASWVPPVTTAGAYVGVAPLPPMNETAAPELMVIERTGSGATATYKGYKFRENIDTG